MSKNDRQFIYKKLAEALTDMAFLNMDDLSLDTDERKAEFMIEKRQVREELLAIANGTPAATGTKKKKSSFNMNKYKTHDGPKGSPEKWREAAKFILNINNENCLTTLGLGAVPATEGDLKKVYRDAIRKAHPDLGGSEEAAARINAAYELALKLFFTKPNTPTPTATRKDTGLRPQLLTPIEESEAINYITDDNWCAQEKKDGKHIIIKKVGYTLIVANKQGLETNIPKNIETAIINLFQNIDVILDGELIGSKFYIFDILEYKTDLRGCNYLERYNTLQQILPGGQFDSLILVPAYFGTADKTAFFNKMKELDKEGVVFKRLDTPFSEGRPETGGNMVKCKFWATLSAIVDEESTGKCSFISYVFDGKGNRVYLGHCTATGKTMPLPGQVVEIKYLYVGAGGRLVQQVLLTIRDDVSPEECTTKQLKYKAKD